jgi:hypothetical protein
VTRAGWGWRHPSAALRLVTVPAAIACWWRAIALEGSPEASVVLGIFGLVFTLLSLWGITPGYPADRVSDQWLRQHEDEQPRK